MSVLKSATFIYFTVVGAMSTNKKIQIMKKTFKIIGIEIFILLIVSISYIYFSVPILIMHGLNDPFIPIEHSKKMATIIPNARTKWFKNMGHDIPINLIDTICEEIIAIINSNNED